MVSPAKFDSLESMSVCNLETVVEKQTLLLRNYGTKLPDEGRKVQAFLQYAHKVLTRKKLTSAESENKAPLSPSPNFQQTIVDKLAELAEFKGEEEESANAMDNLSMELSKLSFELSVDEYDDTENIESHLPEGSTIFENCDYIPRLTPHQFHTLRKALNLPTLCLPKFKWFTFSIIPAGHLAFITVVDCSCRSRYLQVIGDLRIWFPNKKLCNRPPIGLYKSAHLCSSAQALSKLWDFLLDSSDDGNGTNVDPLCSLCLISYNHSPSTDHQIHSLTYLSQLINQNRHSKIARTRIPSDRLRFLETNSVFKCEKMHNLVETTNIVQNLDEIFKLTTDNDAELCDNFLTATMAKSVNACQYLSEILFDNADTDVKLKHFENPTEFMRLTRAKTMTWIEAPVEMRLFQQLKLSHHISNKDLVFVTDEIWNRLALTGLGRSRLTRLAGLFGWVGFASLLAFRIDNHDTQAGSTNAQQPTNKEASTKVLVTDNLNILQSLYSYFREVYNHLARHENLLVEAPINASPKCHQLMPDNIGVDFPTPVHLFHSSARVDAEVKLNDKIQAWTLGGNQLFDPFGARQISFLTKSESVQIMKNAQANYEKSCQSYGLPRRPLTGRIRNLFSYRETCNFDSDTESSSTDSESGTSLALEDVD